MRDWLRCWQRLRLGTPRRVVAEVVGGLLAFRVLMLVVIPLVLLLVLLKLGFLLLMLVGPPVIAILALALASTRWAHGASDWLAAMQAFSWTLTAVMVLSVDVLFVRRVFFRRVKASPRRAG